MIRHLVVVRHAKSSWGDVALPDHDRPLAARGVAALAPLRDHLGDGPPPDLVLCSTARRAIATLDGVRPALPPRAPVVVEPAIYGATAAGLLRLLRGVDDEIGCVLLIGHNPGLEDLVLLVAGNDDRSLRAQVAAKFPTAAAATLVHERSWAELDAGACRLDDLFVPRRPRS